MVEWPLSLPRHHRRKSHCAFLFGCIRDVAAASPNTKDSSAALVYGSHGPPAAASAAEPPFGLPYLARVAQRSDISAPIASAFSPPVAPVRTVFLSTHPRCQNQSSKQRAQG